MPIGWCVCGYHWILAKDSRTLSVSKGTVAAVATSLEGGCHGGYSDLVGQGCAAQASKPMPFFKAHFGWKRYPFLGIFSKF